MRLKHILVPVAFDASSDAAIGVAVELAEKFAAKVTLMHVWSIPTPSYVAGSFSWPTGEIEGPAREALDRLRAETATKHADTDAALLAGVAWEQIVALANERSCDLIVIGTHGRGGIPRLLLGSVAEKVVRASTVPVMTVHPPA